MSILFGTMKYTFQAFLFLIVIYGAHTTWIYIRDSMTPRKTRHLYDSQIQKYKNILEELQEQMRDPVQNNHIDNHHRETTNETEQMEQDLEEFMRGDILTSI
jgi:hypothetical protein